MEDVLYFYYCTLFFNWHICHKKVVSSRACIIVHYSVCFMKTRSLDPLYTLSACWIFLELWTVKLRVHGTPETWRDVAATVAPQDSVEWLQSALPSMVTTKIADNSCSLPRGFS